MYTLSVVTLIKYAHVIILESLKSVIPCLVTVIRTYHRFDVIEVNRCRA